MHIIEAIVLGIVQGLTEFIPVSSSGHLLALPKLFGWKDMGLSFDVALHWGTVVALVIYFWRDWVSILRSFTTHVLKRVPYGANGEADASGRLFIPIIIACVPAAVVGVALDNKIEAIRDLHYALPIVAAAMVVMAAVMLLAERVGQKKREMGKMGYADYIVIGCAQALALIPGVSRSGSTITAGLFRNLNREAAARFSFLLSMPIIVGAGLKKLKDTMDAGLPHSEIMPFVVGFITAAIFGYIAIKFLMSFLQRNSLRAFAIYRFCFVALMIAVFFLHR